MSKFRGKESVKGYVKDVVYDGRTGKFVKKECFGNALARFYAPKAAVETVPLNTAETEALIQEKIGECAYGTVLIASDRETVKRYSSLKEMGIDLFYPSSRNLSNALIVAPAPDVDLSGFCHFIFLDKPLDYNFPFLDGKQVYVNTQICGYDLFKRLDCDRETLLQIYAALKRDLSLLNGNTAEEVAEACGGLGFDESQFIFALHVFEELGLVAFGDGRLTVYRGVKTDLADSALYTKVADLQKD